MENEMETGIPRSSSAPEIQLAHPGIVPTWHAYRIHNHAASAWLTAGLKAHQGTVRPVILLMLQHPQLPPRAVSLMRCEVTADCSPFWVFSVMLFSKEGRW